MQQILSLTTGTATMIASKLTPATPILVVAEIRKASAPSMTLTPDCL